MYLGDSGRYPYGPATAGRGARLRPPDHPAARRRARREARRRRLQHRGGRRPRRAAGRVAGAGDRRDRARRALARAGDGAGPRRRHRHGRARSARAPTRRPWPTPAPTSSSPAPPAPASSSSSSGARPPASRCTCSPSGCSRPVVEAKVDALLLGCTHYPYLARTISDVVGRDVVLVSSADETAFEVGALLAERRPRRRAAGRAGTPPVPVVGRPRPVRRARLPAARPRARHARSGSTWA